jgi:hypothetical protein
MIVAVGQDRSSHLYHALELASLSWRFQGVGLRQLMTKADPVGFAIAVAHLVLFDRE